MRSEQVLKALVAPLLTAFLVLAGGCGTSDAPGPAEKVAEAPVTPAPPATPKTIFEQDLDFVRAGRYTYIWVFSRRDKKPLDKDDSAFLRQHAPQVVDWVTTEGGTKVIAGTNFDLEQGSLNLLKKRFVVEDYSGK